ncbi:MAG: urease accessory protein UreD, partial [Pseudomonadota bacterium]
VVTSTGATRIYRARPERPPARQTSVMRVCENARLEFLPDPLIPFAGARFEQRTTIALDPGATLFWWETLAPGRAAMGEVFDYEWLRFETEIRACGEPIALERAELEPRLRPLGSVLRLGPFRYLATFYICRAGAPREIWAGLERDLTSLAIQIGRPSEVLWGVSALAAHGLVVRGASSSGRPIPGALAEFWRRAKLKLCGQAAVLPRKIY